MNRPSPASIERRHSGRDRPNELAFIQGRQSIGQNGKISRSAALGEVLELADRHDLGSCAARRGSSTLPFPIRCQIAWPLCAIRFENHLDRLHILHGISNGIRVAHSEHGLQPCAVVASRPFRRSVTLPRQRLRVQAGVDTLCCHSVPSLSNPTSAFEIGSTPLWNGGDKPTMVSGPALAARQETHSTWASLKRP